MNLGEGLTNESGASMRFVNDCEIEGSKLLGTFCYNPQAVFPIYFVMRIHKTPEKRGYWKKQRPMQGPEAEWDADAGKYKLYTNYGRVMSGDDIGAWFTFDTQANETLEVSIGVSFVSIENARLNLETEQPVGTTFDKLRADARAKWNDDLSRILVEGGVGYLSECASVDDFGLSGTSDGYDTYYDGNVSGARLVSKVGIVWT